MNIFPKRRALTFLHLIAIGNSDNKNRILTILSDFHTRLLDADTSFENKRETFQLCPQIYENSFTSNSYRSINKDITGQSRFLMGLAHEKGWGVPANSEEATKCDEEAKTMGNHDAAGHLMKLEQPVFRTDDEMDIFDSTKNQIVKK